VVEEKETRMKELMAMMGLQAWVFTASWFLTYFVMFFIIALVQTTALWTSVLKNTDWTLSFLFFLLFNLSCLNLAFLVSTLFSRAKLAGIAGPVVMFAAVMPRYAFFSTVNDEEVLQKSFLSLMLSPSAFAFGGDLLMEYEGANIGMTWATIYDDKFSFGFVLFALAMSFVFYGALAVYFSMVLPNEFGTRRHPCFCIQRLWRRKGGYDRFDNDADDDVDVDNNGNEGEDVKLTVYADDNRSDGGSGGSAGSAYFQQVPASLRGKEALRIRGLRKVFKNGKRSTVAVAGLDMDVYKDGITALLGHNGAGKSTLISMLTGLYAPTRGDATFDGGLRLTKDMPGIRRSMGVCPQRNVLFDTLTVTEHVRMFATLKGVPPADVAAVADAIVADVGLVSKKDAFAVGLSGGQKRKLCLANALVGPSDVVVLDECTSGMDVCT
jgi:ABC-type Na+ transport system ATPase subunit NatA